MSHASILGWVTAVTFCLAAASSLPAQIVEPSVDKEWARAMIDKNQLNINYRNVARGQDVFFKIRVKNIYQQVIHITGLTTSCGCISWDENKGGALSAPIVIPSDKEVTLTLRLDTIRHQGEQKNKRATITFLNTEANPIDGSGTATIVVEGYIRTDVVLQPGSVNFGSVDPEKGAEQRIAVNYAGRNDWRLVSARSNNQFLTCDIVEKLRGNGLVNYELVVKLKEGAPMGALRSQLVLVTDDANNPQIPVLVEARLDPEFVVTEANFGALTPGKPTKISIFVRNTRLPAKAFKIEKFERTKTESTIKVEKSAEAKPFHQVYLTYTPENTPGPYEEEFFLTVSGRSEPITFKARGVIKEAPPPVGTK